MARMKTSGTIRDVLDQKGYEVWSISPEATVFEAIQVMAEKNAGALLAMSGDELAGVISERDYTRKVALVGKSSKHVRVREIMTQALCTVTLKHTVEECLRIMTASRVRHLPVVENHRVIGVVSIGNLVNWIISAQTAQISHLEDFIAGKYPG